MKYRYIILVLLLTSIACNSNKEATNDSAKVLNTTKMAQQKDLMIEYTTMSRGMKEHTKYSEGEIKKSQLLRGKDTVLPSLKLSESAVTALHAIVGSMDLPTVRTTKPPSVKHQRDADKGAVLKISANGDVYESQRFDAGNPPEEFKAILKAIL